MPTSEHEKLLALISKAQWIAERRTELATVAYLLRVIGFEVAKAAEFQATAKPPPRKSSRRRKR
jgi:hypothetical protein